MPEPIRVDGVTKHIIDHIVGHEGEPPSRKYKIRWHGYQPKDDTWEPENKLKEDVPKLLKQYMDCVFPKNSSVALGDTVSSSSPPPMRPVCEQPPSAQPTPHQPIARSQRITRSQTRLS